MAEMSLYDLTATMIAIFATWSIYSQLYGKNNMFRAFTSSLYIGLAMGINVIGNIFFIYPETPGFRIRRRYLGIHTI